MSTSKLLVTLGERIRATRQGLNLTQRQLGKRAGLVDKYVSEIERGNRDVPISTLYKLVERGLELELDLVLRPRDQPRFASAADEVWSRVALLSGEGQRRIAEIVRSILEFPGQ